MIKRRAPLTKGGHATVALLGLFFFAFFAWLTLSKSTDIGELIASARAISPVAYLYILFLSFCNYFFRVVRWRWLCSFSGTSVGLVMSIRHYIAGFAFGVTPARIGEVIRLQFLKNDLGVPYDKGLSIAVADRMGDLISLTLLTLIASLTVGAPGEISLILAASTTLVLVGLLRRPGLFSKASELAFQVIGRGGRVFAGLRRSFRSGSGFYRSKPLSVSLVAGAAAWFSECLGFFIVLQSLNTGVDLPAATLIYSSATLIGALSFLPGGLGGFEAVALVGLTQAGVDMPTAVIAVMVIRLLTLWLSVALGWLMLGRMMLKRRARVRRNGSAES